VDRSGTAPVKWFTVDDWCDPEEGWVVPPAGDAVWEARYENDCERGKRTTRALRGWDLTLLHRLQSPDTLRLCRDRFGFSALPDPYLWGAGLHVTEPGGFLQTHLDYSLNPDPHGLFGRPRRRAVNLIAFCHPAWESGWGGEFYLADPLGAPAVTIDPAPGRLLAFETNDLSYHGVLPVTGPAVRVSVACYLLADAAPADTRRRALYLPNRR
jgi:hypothetical protein